MAKVDLQTPSEIIEKFEHLEFPFIFQKTVVTEDMMQEHMRKLAENGNRTFPKEALCLTWNAENFLGVTPLLRFYLNIGMKITKIHYAVNYTRNRPFKKFVDDMVAVRVAAVGKNDPLGQRAKFTLNSMAGRFG